jgi:hypothetical protein
MHRTAARISLAHLSRCAGVRGAGECGRAGLNREGDFDFAIARLEATARRIEQYAGSDSELRAIVASLRGRHRVYSQPMMAKMRQSEYFGSQNRVTMRDGSGKARQRPNS